MLFEFAGGCWRCARSAVCRQQRARQVPAQGSGCEGCEGVPPKSRDKSTNAVGKWEGKVTRYQRQRCSPRRSSAGSSDLIRLRANNKEKHYLTFSVWFCPRTNEKEAASLGPKRQQNKNQSIMMHLNEGGNVAQLILLIRLSISPQRPNPRAIQAGSDQAEDKSFAPHFSSLFLSTWIYLSAQKPPSLSTDRSLYLFAYKPVTINDYSNSVIRTLMTSATF